MASFAVRYQGWTRQPEESVVRFRLSIERDGQPFQAAVVPVGTDLLESAQLDPPDDQLGTALILEVATDIEQAVVERVIPLNDALADYELTPVPEARVRELIAADATPVVHANGIVFTFEQSAPAN
ncbi:MAG TPA: hypothetical protein VGL60_06015 [Acidimicrobiales bacterium]